MKFTFVTGNQEKLREFTRLFPADFAFDHTDLDLDEIQSLDPKVVITDKVKRAYKHIKKPVVVEDVSAGLDHLNGLPGPFIKFFNQQLGKDALHQLAGDKTAATAICTIAYYDGNTLIIASGEVKGNVVPMRTENGFGFDCIFVPSGHDKTFAEMEPRQKDALSHRGHAVRDLINKLPSS